MWGNRAHTMIILVIACSCNPKATQQASTANYEEDLSAYRPVIPEVTSASALESGSPSMEIEYVEPTKHINAELDSILKIKAARSLEIGYLQGFSIQIYSGRSREEANNAKQAVYELLEDETAEVYYDQPVFRVKVGKYFSKLEAEPNFQALRKSFPQALVLPERIPIK